MRLAEDGMVRRNPVSRGSGARVGSRDGDRMATQQIAMHESMDWVAGQPDAPPSLATLSSPC